MAIFSHMAKMYLEDVFLTKISLLENKDKDLTNERKEIKFLLVTFHVHCLLFVFLTKKKFV